MTKKTILALLGIVLGCAALWLLWQQNRPEPAGTSVAATGAVATVGNNAAMFKTNGALAGKPFALDLAKELKKGPVVLYFFPKVFTEGCTLEAREFAEKSADFAKLGASVFGLSGDDLPGLTKFSSEACRDKFAVAQATPAIMDAYDVKMPAIQMANRTSFVIAQDGKIAFVHSEMDYRDHVKLTYAAVERLAQADGGTAATAAQ